jgi:hypothetical protein
MTVIGKLFRRSSFVVRRTLALMLCGVLFVTACAAPGPAPTTPLNAETVVVPFTPNPQDVPLPTLLPTVVVPPTQPAITVLVTAIPTITPIPLTATVARVATQLPRATATPAESATPFPEDVPKVFVTALRVEPATPKASDGGTYFVTFQNASGENTSYNWAVEIWDTENSKRPFGLTAPQSSAMPMGVSTFTSTGWTVKGLGECHAYRARVVARDEDDNRSPFIQLDGSILWLDFTVCP